MKLFKQLLVAPAALGLLAPVAATAAEFNLDGVNKYASEEQVTSISQFSDVKPTDWAYQALSNLIERYGCVAGYPDGTYKGARAMTRFEAAALLNACLDRVTEVTDELKKLMAEFEKELAILKGRVDGLEAKVGQLEANQFSTTTKLKGIATMVLGGASGLVNGTNESLGEVTFNYDLKLDLDTSFTGKDLLRTRLRSSNFQNSVFGTGNTLLEVAFQETNNSDIVGIDRLFYKFPIGDSFTATFGAKVRQDDMLAMWPSVYPGDSILDMFTLAGAAGTYNLSLGAGAGVSYMKNGFNLSANFVSAEADAANSLYGVGEGYTFTFQAGYAATNWGLALAYAYGDYAGSASASYNQFGYSANPNGSTNYSNNVGLSGYWQPSDAGWVPSISAGVGFGSGMGAALDTSSYSWMAGLQWTDVFIKGNALGMALGTSSTASGGSIIVKDTNSSLAYELWYKFQVTDNISVTPAFFYIGTPNGFDDTFGGLVKTTFKF